MNPIRQYRKKPVVVTAWQTSDSLDIKTLEGEMHASPGDWIITGVNGEQYPCKPDIFEKTYEPADLEPTPDALELAMELRAKCYTHSNGGDYSGESSFDIYDAAQLIAAHDARLLDEAAERGVELVDAMLAHLGGLTPGGKDKLRAAIKGAAHE